MRFTDQLIFEYSDRNEAARRLSLARLEDIQPEGDVFLRASFLGERALADEGILRHQAMTGFAALLSVRRLAGWGPGSTTLAAVPVLEPHDLEASGGLSPIDGLAIALGADLALLRQLERSLSEFSDAFPIALGLAFRPESQWRVLELLHEANGSDPALPLLLGPIFGDAAAADARAWAASRTLDARISVLRTLPRHPERDWTEAFDAATHEGSEEVILHGLAALGRIATPLAAQRLARLAQGSTGSAVRIQALRSIALIGTEAVPDHVGALLASGDPEQEAAALEVALTRGLVGQEIEQSALELAGSTAPMVQGLALAVLARQGEGTALRRLESLMSHETPHLRTAAMVGLGLLDDARAQERLETVGVRDASRTVASTALRFLVRKRASLDPTVFREALARGGIVARAASEVLVWRAARAPGEVFEVLGQKPQGGAGLLALGAAVAACGARDGLGLLADLLRSSDPETAGWAAEALYAVGAAAPCGLLAACLRAGLPKLRARAAVALSLAGDVRGTVEIKRLAADPTTRAQAARAILDLAAILPAVRHHPLFAQANLLIPADVELPRRLVESSSGMIRPVTEPAATTPLSPAGHSPAPRPVPAAPGFAARPDLTPPFATRPAAGAQAGRETSLLPACEPGTAAAPETARRAPPPPTPGPSPALPARPGIAPAPGAAEAAAPALSKADPASAPPTQHEHSEGAPERPGVSWLLDAGTVARALDGVEYRKGQPATKDAARDSRRDPAGGARDKARDPAQTAGQDTGKESSRDAARDAGRLGVRDGWGMFARLQSQRQGAWLAIVAGLIVGASALLWSQSHQGGGGATLTLTLPPPSARPLPALSFFPFSALATSLERAGQQRRDFQSSDILGPGDAIDVAAAGSAILSSAGGSQLECRASSGLRFAGETPSRQGGTAFGFDRLHGTLALKWKESHRLHLAVEAGELESDAVELDIEPGRIEVKSGDARWYPRAGEPASLGAGFTLDLTAVR